MALQGLCRTVGGGHAIASNPAAGVPFVLAVQHHEGACRVGKILAAFDRSQVVACVALLAAYVLSEAFAVTSQSPKAGKRILLRCSHCMMAGRLDQALSPPRLTAQVGCPTGRKQVHGDPRPAFGAGSRHWVASPELVGRPRPLKNFFGSSTPIWSERC